MNQDNRRGFTLVELLVVISIISLLSSIILAALNQAKLKAQESKRLQEKNLVRTALSLYKATYGTYPIAAVDDWRCFGPSSVTCWRGAFTGSDSLVSDITPFLPKIPTTNTDSSSYSYNYYKYGNFTNPTQTYLVWYKSKPISAAECPSPSTISNFDAYYYCYELLPN